MHDAERPELIILPNTLVFYVDDTGDESLGDPAHPVFAFGGVACVAEHHVSIARNWQRMKATTFPKVNGPLHSKTHLREKISPQKWTAVRSAVNQPQLGRFGAIMTRETSMASNLTSSTVVLMTLANRLAGIARGMIERGLWNASGQIYVIFEASTRFRQSEIERHYADLALNVGSHRVPIEGCFMPKEVSNPFLEMADFVVSTIARNVKFQLDTGHEHCTPNFQSLFRDFGSPLADYSEVTVAG